MQTASCFSLQNSSECFCLTKHFVFICICGAISCLMTSSLSARSWSASYSSRAAVFRHLTSSHSAGSRA